jgi:hypothetical protein
MAAPPVFPPKGEALAILQEELQRAGSSVQPAFTIEKQKRPGSQRLGWWHDDAAAEDDADLSQALALLRTYDRITGGRPLPAGGVRLRKDRVWMDRPIIGRLEREGLLAFEPTGHFEPSFIVTEKGRRWMATGELTT